MTGEIIGKVTLRNVCQRPAPSTFAASYRTVGTACNPATKMRVMFPMPQMLMIMSAGNAQLASANQPDGQLAARKEPKMGSLLRASPMLDDVDWSHDIGIPPEPA